ncbi:ROK family protein [Limnoglobus roseus]|uniref:ROK family protein n=1 Tax=Limnoglobus roseus TaxID=2598579 RepID=A0A5C1AQA4_9BACT|nr:ROK family protein [Limnoglobus roseus]QEL20367.1 ROK family protein [Limnoglobus roseus]
MKVLVIDIGGSHVKFLATGVEESRSFDSGPELTPEDMVKRVREHTADWEYTVVSLGYPGVVGPEGPEAEPGNLGDGWVGFDYEKAFGKPVRVVNDAVLQALGGYQEGRMLFLGLGTGLGSALVTERVVIPLELGSLPYARGESLADRLGKAGLQQHGEDNWRASLTAVTGELMKAFQVDEILLGGGNAELIDPPPEGCRRGGNQDAMTGGFRLWDEWIEGHDYAPSGAWRVVR